MISFDPSGFWSAGVVAVLWGLTDHNWGIVFAGVMLIAISFRTSFFRQFDRG